MPARIGVVGTARTVRGRLGVPGREAMVRRRCCAVLVLVVALAFFYGVDTPPRVLSLAREGRGVTGAVARPFGRLPLRFEANVGQFDPRVAYVARQPGATLFLTGEGATLALRSTRQMGDPSHIPRERRPDARSPTRPGVAVRMKVVGGRAVAPRGGLQLETKSNYFLGDDPTKWRTNVASYGRVVYPRVLDGVDLVYHGEDGQLEYDFVVAPGSDPATIMLEFGGASSLTLSATGDLEIGTTSGALIQRAPHVFQRDADGVASDVRAAYRLARDKRVGFEVASYDRTRPLVIDPVLVYSTYLGGTGEDQTADAQTTPALSSSTLAVDATDHVYIAGYTTSTDFPVESPVQAANAGGSDVFVGKLKSDGSALVYATYLGGSAEDAAGTVAVDASGNAYVIGHTYSTNFPTQNAIQPANASVSDAFVAKLSPDGSALVYSTYLGGNAYDFANGLVVDAAGAAYVTGSTDSTTFPLKNPIQGSNGGAGDAFVTKISADGSSLVYSTFLGGSVDDGGGGIAVDSTGAAYAIGYTNSANFPTHNARQPAKDAGADAYVAKISPDGSTLAYSTFVGGSSDDIGIGIAVDASGNAYATGYTGSPNFPTKNPLQATKGGSLDVFITKLTADGAGLVYSSFIGGGGADIGYGVALDPTGGAHITGYTLSVDFPTVGALQSKLAGGVDAFVTKVKPDGSGLAFSTFLGGTQDDFGRGLAVSAGGTIHVKGSTQGAGFPQKSAVQGAYGGGSWDAFICDIQLSPLRIAPLSATLAPGAPKVFSATGGAGGYMFELQTKASGPTTGIDRTTGAYIAGSGAPGANTVDVVRVTDAVGATATANVNVTPGLAITASKTSLLPNESVQVTASDGSGAGFAWSIANPSDATIGATGPTVSYTAGPTGNRTDTVQVKDSNGNVATVNMAIGAISVNPASPNPAPHQTIAFVASGGSGVGYQFSFVGAPGSGADASISASGIYKAGTAGGVTDHLKVVDSLGNALTFDVPVKPGITISASPSLATPPRGKIAFGVSGGSGMGYVWSVAANSLPGASIDASGLYEAGVTGGVTDMVTVHDTLGNTSTVAVTVKAGISIQAPVTSLAPNGSTDLGAAGGSNRNFVWTFAVRGSGSGATIDAATGLYHAGSSGSTKDTIRVTDDLANTATVDLNVTAGVTITPAAPAAIAKGSVNLAASGGTGGPFTWTVPTNNSGGATVDGAGHFRAGATSKVVDTVQASDALGNKAAVNVSIADAVAINPSLPNVYPRGAIAFAVSGGSLSGFTWSLASNASGGTIDAASGAYTAGATPNTKDTVKVVDSLGIAAQVDVTVNEGVSIEPTAATVAPVGAQRFGVAGGSGTGFVWSVSSNPSGGRMSGSLYAAGPNGSTTDVVTVTDSLGNSASANVTVTAAIAIDPISASVPVKGSENFNATGGAPPYSFALVVDGSGANISSTGGAYTAGARASVLDVVVVTDANGATATATANVGAMISIAPATPMTTPRGALAFSANGGNATGYAWSVLIDASKGATIGAKGDYTAGVVGPSTDVVKVTDSLGNAAGVAVSVGGGLAASPMDTSVSPRGVVAFTAFGGSGEGYRWSLVTSASGGAIDAASGVYTAGATPDVIDVVRLTDHGGGAIAMNVRVGPGVAIAPPSATLMPATKQRFAVGGGSGAGYAWSLASNRSGASLAADGTYTAGAIPGVTDVVTVTDSMGNSASATVTVVDAPGSNPSLPPNKIDAGCSCIIITGAARETAWAPLLAVVLGTVIFARRRRSSRLRDCWRRRLRSETTPMRMRP